MQTRNTLEQSPDHPGTPHLEPGTGLSCPYALHHLWGGLTSDRRIRKSSAKFFIPVKVLRDKFKGKYLSLLDALYQQEKLVFSSSCRALQEPSEWKTFKNNLYGKDWCPYIKETFNGFVTPSNIWDAIPTGLRSPTTGSFPLRKQKSPSLHVAETRGSKAADHSQLWRVYPAVPDACAPRRFPEDPLLWIPQ